MVSPVEKAELRRQFEEELTRNILPFWMTHAVDETHGGLHGTVTNDLRVDDDVPRSAVLCARVLWTFSAAHRRLGDPAYLAVAERMYDALTDTFWDPEHGGLYWQIDREGCPVADRKHHYAQAFGIYGLSEFHRATGHPRSLELARALFDLLEEHAHDPVEGGYFEGSTRAWRPLADARLSEKDLHAPKSMNTMLHVLEAYTNLLRTWDDELLRSQLARLIRTFLTRIFDPRACHFGTFFDEGWTSLTDTVSFGHDIEGSWLLCEASDACGDPALRAEARRLAVTLADAVLRDGTDADGGLFSEGSPSGVLDRGKDWWPQAEGIVGFYNASQITGEDRFAEAAIRCWRNAQDRFVDRTNGGWFKRLTADGTPDTTREKAGPWDCPYHHSRACLEMMERLEQRE